MSEEGSASLFRKRLVNDLCSCLLLRIAFLLFSLGPPLSLSLSVSNWMLGRQWKKAHNKETLL